MNFWNRRSHEKRLPKSNQNLGVLNLNEGVTNCIFMSLNSNESSKCLVLHVNHLPLLCKIQKESGVNRLIMHSQFSVSWNQCTEWKERRWPLTTRLYNRAFFFSFDKRIVLIRLSGPPNFIINDRQSMPQVPKSDFEGFNTVDKISV